jgi:hypothetical protein
MHGKGVKIMANGDVYNGARGRGARGMSQWDEHGPWRCVQRCAGARRLLSSPVVPTAQKGC